MSREAIREIFKNTGVEALFITDPHNMWYLSVAEILVMLRRISIVGLSM